MSFLDKIRKTEEAKNKLAEAPKEVKTPSDFLQLAVDIYETPTDIIIFAPVPGADIQEIDITIENENDVVVIQGKSILPYENKTRESQLLRSECKWGGFYRQIILPSEVNVNEAEAKLKKGILILRLPLLRVQGNVKKKIEVRMAENKI